MFSSVFRRDVDPAARLLAVRPIALLRPNVTPVIGDGDISQFGTAFPTS